jgi:hypothetical protein
MSDRELEQKFFECAEWSRVDRAVARRIAQLVWRIEELADVRELTHLLAAGSR